MLPIKRKINSAIWRLKQAGIGCYQGALKLFVETLTARYWLLDYVPLLKNHPPVLLLVRLDLIGDFIIWLDSAQRYRALYPNHKIVLAVNSSCTALARNLPFWDEVVSIDVDRLRSNATYRLRVLWGIRVSGFSIAIQPIYSREVIGDSVVRATNATQRIGFQGDCNNISEGNKTVTDRWYTQLVGNPMTAVSELNINAHFLRTLGDVDYHSRIFELPRQAILSDTLKIQQPYIVVAPGASWLPKQWPALNFTELITKLHADCLLPIVLCGGPNEIELCKNIQASICHDWLINFTGQTTLVELVELIRDATLLVSNDSAPIHMAAVTGTNSICILGGGHFNRFLPYAPESISTGSEPVIVAHPMECYGCRWKCIYNLDQEQAVPCVSQVPVLAVYHACSRALNLQNG